MRLTDYQWSRNPRGLHVQRILITPLERERWTRPQMGWVKLIAAGEEYLDDAAWFLDHNVTPILRPYRARWGARPMDRAMRDQILMYARAGVKWFEFHNEPNLDIEWPEGIDPDWRDTQNIIRPLMDNWLVFAEFVISLGCYPGFIALAESDEPRYSAVRWMDAMLTYLAENRYDRFKNVLAGGAFCATHPYILNHFYQEKPGGGPLSARPPHEQNAEEGGWHFEYPYDPICQANDPGRTVYGGTRLTPNGDPNGLIAMGRMFNERCAEWFGSQAIPVVGTEGGIWPYREGPMQQDNRYPPYTEESQAEATVAMFDWIARHAPPWFFGLTLWKEDDYYFNGTNSRAIDRMAELEPAYKHVPPLDVMRDGFTGAPLGPDGRALVGPGPIQGQAEYHMVVLSPGLDPAWFFETAQSYWTMFRPMVTTDLRLIDLVPYESSLATTVIAAPDQVHQMTQAIQERYPNVWFDLIIASDLDDVRALLNERVLMNRRFG
ncbi:MAG: hypothetical protein DIU68_017205 [Chloroflexota bacterium]|nr:MAG: hypothetical protein DIU68_06905 [Chloroflexota bacterium]